MEKIFKIRDLETLKVVSDPLRVKIFDMVCLANRAGELRTVKQISEQLDIPPHKLYYHINLLEKHGLMQVAETQIVSGIIEKHYQVSARQLLVDRELFQTELNADERTEAALALLDGVFEAARDDMIRALNLPEAEKTASISERKGHITRDLAHMSQAQVDAFHARLMELIKEFEEMEAEEGAESGLFSLTVIMLPTRTVNVPSEKPPS